MYQVVEEFKIYVACGDMLVKDPLWGESGKNRGGEGRVRRFYLKEMAGGSVEGTRVGKRKKWFATRRGCHHELKR